MTSYEMFVEKFKKRYQEVHNLTSVEMCMFRKIIDERQFDCAVPCVFEGSKEECEKWIKEHTKKTWLEENYPLNDYCTYIDISLNESKRESVKEVCKKIVQEFQDDKTIATKDVLALQEIIKNLGVEYENYF